MLPGKNEPNEFQNVKSASEEESSSEAVLDASRTRQEEIDEENFLATITDLYTAQIFRRPVFLIGKHGGSEVVELATAIHLQQTTNKLPITGETIIRYVETTHLNALIDGYMRKNPSADRYPEYPSEETVAKQAEFPARAVGDVAVAVEALGAPGRNGVFGQVAPNLQPNSSIYLPQVIAVKPNSYRPEMKISSYGDADAGKTALLNSMGMITRASFITTIGVDFRIINRNGVKFQWYDRAGQDRFREITLSSFTEIDAIVVMTSTAEHFENMMTSLLTMSDNGAANYHYYGVQYSADGQITALTRVLNQENPETLPRVSDFTSQGFGVVPVLIAGNNGQLGTLAESFLDNIAEIGSMPVAEAAPAYPPNNRI